MKRRTRDDYDGAWKKILEEFLSECFQLCFPEIHAAIDWSVPPEFRDTARMRLGPRGRSRHRHVDKLVVVALRDGTRKAMYVIVEVHARKSEDFEKRLLFYTVRVMEDFEQPLPVAILIDADPSWRPVAFEGRVLNSRILFEFPTVKLLDFETRRDELTKSDNPFVWLVLAQLDSLRTKRKPKARILRKSSLAKDLLRRGKPADVVGRLMYFLDWLLGLPDELDDAWYNDMQTFSEETQMPFVSIFERKGMEKGMEKGMQKGKEEGKKIGGVEELRNALLPLIRKQFGSGADGLIRELRTVEDLDTFRSLGKLLYADAGLDAFEEVVRRSATA